jgi:3-oxoacyl-[acyl-carrier protein] reductase
MDLRLAGKVVVVTGASGGIGWAVADLLAREGARLVLQGHTQVESLRSRVDGSALAARAHVVAADLRQPEGVEAVFDEAVTRFGGADGCVACAGIWPAEPLLLSRTPVDRIKDILEGNLLTSLLTARSFLSQVEATGRQGSSLVLVGSTAARFGEAFHTEYAAAKAGLRGLLLSYKNEVVRVDAEGRCNLVEPGWTATPMAAEALESDELVIQALRTMPLRRVAAPRDVASTIAFLLSPLSRHVTGECLMVAGGMEGRLLWREEDIDPGRARGNASS